jgi:hypothetical protein
MRNYIWMGISIAIFLVGCAPSESVIQTARAETEVAKPTETFTPQPTSTYTQTPTEPPTNTPTEIPTATPFPESAFRITYEEMRGHFEDWTGSDFKFFSELRGAKVYSGNYKDLEMEVFLYDIAGNAVGYALRFVQTPTIEVRDQIDFIFNIYDFYLGLDALLWIGENWPTVPGESNITQEKTIFGDVIMVLKYLEGYTSPTYIVGLWDKNYTLEEESIDSEGIVDDLASITGTNIDTPTSISPTAPPADEASNEYFDERIGLSVTKVENSKDLAAEYDLPDPGEGYTYLSVHLTVNRIEEVHLSTILGFGEENPVLHDSEGQSYTLFFGKIVGIRFKDLHDITSLTEMVEGAEGVLVFKIPEGQVPASLDLIYSYRETWEEDSPKLRGELTIFLEDAV